MDFFCLFKCKNSFHRMAEAIRNLLSEACVFSLCLELKHVLDMIQLENVELERVKVQHNQKLDQLEKSQESLLQVSPGLFKARITGIPGFLPLFSKWKTTGCLVLL